MSKIGQVTAMHATVVVNVNLRDVSSSRRFADTCLNISTFSSIQSSVSASQLQTGAPPSTLRCSNQRSGLYS
eukprot:m.8451 g.8451  ORF g.8451 m.8451 type:complete len:72 (-) comp2283_c0_seq2:605-820(-)